MNGNTKHSEPVVRTPMPATEDIPLLSETARKGPTLRTAAITAGVGILVMSVLAGFGSFVVSGGLVTPGDAARTARDVSGSETLFRFGIVSLLLTAVADVVVAWALYRVFRLANAGLSMLAAWFRLAYAATFLVAVSQLLAALRVLDGLGHDAAFTTDQVHSQALSDINAFGDIWIVGLVLFGAHLFLVSYLAYRSEFFPNYLAILIFVAGGGYVFDGLAAVLANGSPPKVSSFTFVGEFGLALWLVIRGRHIPANEPADPDSPATTPGLTRTG